MTEQRRFTAQEKLDAVERELRFRRRVYPNRVGNGKMTHSAMVEQLALFEQIADDYREKAKGERLI